MERMSIVTPPYIDGSNYDYWKERMHIYLKAQDVSMWDYVMIGWTNPKKHKKEWSTSENNACTVNYRALNVIMCVVSSVEFQRICNLKTPKEA